MFACAIYSQEASKAAGKVDWRSAIDELRHEAYELPIEIQAKCVNLIKKLDLQMGCIDMIVTPDDQYVFLEVNPQGQWLWIEEKTSLPIAEAIADLLVTRDGIK